MVKHECPTCKHDFQRKSTLDDHINKKNKCKPLVEHSAQITRKNAQPTHETAQLQQNNLNVSIPITNENVCNYCEKSFTRKDILTRHIKQSCPVAKQQNKEKQDIFDKLLLLETKNKELEEKLKIKDKQLEEEIKNKNKHLENEIKKLKKEIKKVQPITNNNTMNNNTMNNNVGNTTNIIMVAHGHEDLSKITPKMLSTACKKGYNSIVQLVETVHFNPKFPEFHNVYIPSVKDKHAMIYYDEMWNLKNKDDVVNDMYDTSRDYIMENIEGINNYLNDGEKRALNRWIDSEKNKDKSDKDKKAIDCTHENLKLLLHNKRHIPVGTRKQKTAITM